jgi:pantoate--beta-alanine ligase
MKEAKTIQELRKRIPDNQPVGFVPTMGALHEGHLSLVRAAKSRGLFTVASIFVNPTQFNDPKDFEKYPIDTNQDRAKLISAGCDLLFLPSREVIYPETGDKEKYIHDFGHLEQKFEGAFRPGHFRGVGQVVHILFEAVQPQVAFFGEKDFQQLQVIRRLVEMTNMEVEIVGMETVREEDGLAMSSRNRRLGPKEREESVLLYEVMQWARRALKNIPLEEIRAEVKARIDRSDTLRLEYFDIIDPKTFEPREDGEEGDYHVVIAAYAGEVRLIDNMKLG